MTDHLLDTFYHATTTPAE